MALSDNQPLPVRLSAMRYGARDIILYELEPLSDKVTLPSVQAGSHLDVILPGGMIRQYSLLTHLCNESVYVIAVKREPSGRGGSRWLHDMARIGQVIEVGIPRNHFALVEGESPVLLLAGGIGITPIISMYQTLQEQGRKVKLHYWSQSPAHALFSRLLQEDPDVCLHFGGENRLSVSEVLGNYSEAVEIYCCGPARMLDELERCGCSHRLHIERFQANNAAINNEQFSVVLARSGAEYVVSPGQSILDVLRDAGVDALYSCEEGICGACEVKVLQGTPCHADSVRSKEEHTRRGTMMICCSGSASASLVLDL